MFQQSRHYRFPWRGGQHFDLLVDGQHFFDWMLKDISSANDFIYLEMYLFESGNIASHFINEFIAAAERGVRVFLLLDDYGSSGLHRADRHRLEHNNIKLRYYNPLRLGRWRHNLARDHRKLLLVDGRLAYTGGTGITDAFDQSQDLEHYWHEAMVRIGGSCVSDWQTLFEHNWQRHAGAINTTRIEFAADEGNGLLGRVSESRAMVRSEVIRSFLKHVRSARQQIYVASAYFVPSRKIRRELCRSAARGVDVRLLLPGPRSDHPWVRHMGRRYYDALLRHGVRIYEYQPRFMHMKVLLCDNWSSIGSSNLDRWNFRWNLEANQEVKDEGFATTVKQLFVDDFSESLEIDAAMWHQRPYWVRFKVWAWSQVTRLLSWFSFNR